MSCLTPHFTHVLGDDLSSQVVTWQLFADEGVTALNATGFAAELVIESTRGVELLRVSTAGGAGNRLVWTDAATGQLAPDVTPANQADLAAGVHRYQLRLTDGSARVTTWIEDGVVAVREAL